MLNSNNKNEFISFPEDFVWGCATSPTQVEGNTVNEWDDFIAKDGSRADDASKHWQRYKYDFNCLASMNLNAYRMGFDWARLQPGPREPLERDIKLRYMEMLAELRGWGIEPYLTLFHHACPKWFRDMGGWLNPESPELFADFVRRVVVFTDNEVKFWIPINEPNCYAFLAYIAGVFPPRKKARISSYSQVLRNMRKAQAMAYREIKNLNSDASVGASCLVKEVQPSRRWHFVDSISSAMVKRVFGIKTLEGFVSNNGEQVADFIGVNFHGKIRTRGFSALSPMFVKKPILKKHNIDCDDMWEQDAAWVPICLNEIYSEYKLPLYVTGHGVATQDEGLRVRQIKAHLLQCNKVIEQGVDLRGYFYWSLLDNFEWGDGLSRHFGLVSVAFDDPTRRRDIRRSGCIFGEIARNKGFYI